MPTSPVKTPRAYDNSRRRAQADERRSAIVRAARDRFIRVGYTAATVADIARDADVSVESIYKGFRNKAGLVRAVWTEALGGDQGPPAERRSDASAESATSARDLIHAWATLTMEVGPLAGPILGLVHTAALTDPEAAAFRDEMEAGRAARMMHNAGHLVRRGELRPGVTQEQARDIMLVYTNLYEPLVSRGGWSPAQFGEFVERGLSAHLLA